MTTTGAMRAVTGRAPAPDAADVLLLAFLATLAALAMGHRQPGLVPPIALLGGAIVSMAAWARRVERVRVLHDFFPVAAVIATFELLGPVIPAVNPVRWDATFAELDVRLFGALPAAWLGVLGRPSWLSDFAAIAYVTYYPLPVVLAAALYVRDRSAFRDFAVTVVATFLVSYVGYLLFPTLGPRVADESVLGGGGVTRAVRTFIQAAENNQLDAFPSGHVAVALVCVGLGWRTFARWRALLALVLAGIAFSTVYLSYHYVIDVAAGAVLGTVVLAVHGWAQRPVEHGLHRRPSHASRSKRAAR
jgi:membrane-associated phospholipid phosphatase